MHEVEMGTWLKSVKDSTNQQDVLKDTLDSFVPPRLREKQYDSMVSRRSMDRSLLANAEPMGTSEVREDVPSHDNLEGRVKSDDDPSISKTSRR